MFWPERSAGIASFRPVCASLRGDGRAELLVDEHARDGRVGAGADGLQEALEDQVLGVGDDRRLLGVGLALDPEELLLEGAAMVEGEDVELLVISEVHSPEYSKGVQARGREVLRMVAMTSGADLFVVCKQCGSEVSPYITECPYCGHRLRRRAPKLPRRSMRPSGAPALAGRDSDRCWDGAARARRRGRLPAARAIRSSRWAATRPYATIALVAACCVAWVAIARRTAPCLPT